MNPLFLLFGLLSTGAGGMFLGKSSSDSAATYNGSLTDPTGNQGNSGKQLGPELTRFEPNEPEELESSDPTPTAPEDTYNLAPNTPEEPEASDPTPATPQQPEASVPTPTEPEPEPEQPTGPYNPAPTAPEQTGSGGGDGAYTPPTIVDGTVDVYAGRVTTLQPSGDDITGITVTSGVSNGTVTVNPDNSLALVMTHSDFTGSQNFTYEATHSDGSTTLHQVDLNVTAGLQAGGWGTSESHYMLETDADGRIVVEHGEEHIKVYVSGANDALSLADIARAEGMNVSQVTGEFLANNGYGQSEDLALAEDAGRLLWQGVSGSFSETSNWLLLERGYEYGDMGNILARGASGESEMNPLYIGAWGSGDRPEITSYSAGYLNDNDARNIVIQDLHFSGGYRLLSTHNVIFDNIKVTDEQLVIMHSSGVTIRNSEFYDCTTDSSANLSGTWDSHGDRQQGLFANFVDGLLAEGLFLDHNGWEEGYREDASVDGVQPPGINSHNLYFGTSITDLTVRDSISMRAGATGMILRSGGFFEDIALIDNNAAIVFKGGDHGGEGPTGSYTLLADSLVISGAHRESAINTGGLTMGIRDEGELTALVDNIVAHLADPNNPDELAEKTVTQYSVTTENTFYDDTIVYNWQGSGQIYNQITEQNTTTLDSGVLDQTTIQNFTAQLLGTNTATIADLADYLRAQGDGAFDDIVDADLIIRFFQEGFGIAPDIRTSATTLRFVPDETGDGVRWDNRLNWDTEDLPGLFATDSVELGGNDVVFGSNTTINTLDMGYGSNLNVYGGRLELNGGLTGNQAGTLNTEGTGQVWTDGSDAIGLDIAVDGGRFVNTGTMEGANLTATGGQTILATGGAEYDVGASKTLAVFDAIARIGFDGDTGGTAILDLHEGATLAFSAQGGDLGSIEEFRSGAFGDVPDVQSGIDLGGADLSINLAGLTASAGTAFTLMDADELIGVFNEAGVNVSGLGARNARIVIDYESDRVTLELSSGNGSVSVDTIGTQGDVSSGEQALWNALTEGQGVVPNTSAAMVIEDEDDLLDVAA